MATAIGKYAANKMLSGQLKKYAGKNVSGDQDPYYAMIPDPRKPGKMKKVKKQVPTYIPEHDAIILAKMRKRAYSLDMALFDAFGLRFGWSSVIGIIPAAGDVADALLALMLVMQCNKVECGLGQTIIIRMLLNVLIDFFIGAVPLLGDIADAAFKANTRNVRLLEKRLDEAYKPDTVRAQHKEIKRQHNGKWAPRPATEYEDFGDEAEDRRQFVRDDRMRQNTTRTEPVVPAAAAQKPVRNGWFSNVTGGGRRQQPDIERGNGQEVGSVVNGQQRA